MISYGEALAMALQHAHRLPTESIPLEVAHGRILAEPVVSRCPIPPVDQAALEGYALHCGERRLPAGTEVPLLPVRRLAREPAMDQQGVARRIHCDAIMPNGLDAVLPLELGQRLPPDENGMLRLRLKAPLTAWKHVRRAGTEAAAGAEVLPAGLVLDAPRILLAASVGAERLRVVARPQIAILSTGQGQPRAMDWYCPGATIRDVNASYLEMMSRTIGADVRLNQSLGQGSEYFETMLQQARDMALHLIICTRGDGALRPEQMMASLRALDARILFHTVAFSPGQSLICARFPRGTLFFGLLADPAAMAAAYRFFLMPTLGQMQGRAAEKPILAALAPPLHPGSSRLPSFRRGRLHQHADGSLWVQVPRSDDPCSIRATSGTNAWVVIPPHTATWRGETRLQVYGTMPDMLDIPVEPSRN